MIPENVRYGATMPSLKDQGFGFMAPHRLALHQECADAISRLYISEVLTETETTKARKRLTARIFKDACAAQASQASLPTPAEGQE